MTNGCLRAPQLVTFTTGVCKASRSPPRFGQKYPSHTNHNAHACPLILLIVQKGFHKHTPNPKCIDPCGA